MSVKNKRRQTIGADPLDSVIPSAPAPLRTEKVFTAETGEERQSYPSAAVTRSVSPVKTARRIAKVRATFHIPEDLFDAARDAVVALSGPPNRLTLAQFAEDALRREIERLRKKHNGDQPFPRRDGELRGGRPIGS